MNLRSRGNITLTPINDNINKLTRRKRRLQFNTPEMENQEQDNQHEVHQDNINNENIQQDDVPARRVLIGAGDAPNIYDPRYGIVPPPIQRNDFEIQGNLLSSIQNKTYNGLQAENPIDHLLQFERICNLTKKNGVSEDALKLRLFPFSLSGAAAQWEMHLKPGSITTWDQCRTAFLAKWYTPNRTAKVRSQISGFTQYSNESFSEAWERFKRYQSECPHHNVPKDTLLSTFYRGLLPDNRRMLDTASNGNFLLNTIDVGYSLIENMANSDAIYGGDHDRMIRKPQEQESSRNKDIKALNDKIDRLILGQQRNQDAKMICEEDAVQVEEVCYVQNNNYRNQQGGFFNNQYKQNPGLSYRSTNVANPQDQTYPQQQQTAYQPKPYAPKQQYGTYKPPFMQQQNQQQQGNQDVTSLLNQILKEQTSHTTELSTIRNELNKKIDASHAELSNKFEQLNSRVQFLEGNTTSSSNAQTTNQLPGKAVQNPREYSINSITVEYDHNEQTEVAEDSNVQKEEAAYTRKVPKESGHGAEKPVQIERKLSPFGDRSRINGLSRYERLVHQDREAPRAHEGISKVMPIVEKQRDPGEFTLSCAIWGTIFPKCIVDTGASMCTIPLSVARRLGFTDFTSCAYKILFADKTSKEPHGELHNVPVEIGGVMIPTDFTVLETMSEKEGPIILGRPFLVTTQAMIDMKDRVIELTLGGDSVRFNSRGKVLSGRTRYGFRLQQLRDEGDGTEYQVKGGRLLMPHEWYDKDQDAPQAGPYVIGTTRYGEIELLKGEGTWTPPDGKRYQIYLKEVERGEEPLYPNRD